MLAAGVVQHLEEPLRVSAGMEPIAQPDADTRPSTCSAEQHAPAPAQGGPATDERRAVHRVPASGGLQSLVYTEAWQEGARECQRLTFYCESSPETGNKEPESVK